MKRALAHWAERTSSFRAILTARYRASLAWRWAIDLGLMLIALIAIGAFQTRHHPRGVPPALSLSTLDGRPTSLAAFAGKPTLVAVWAPWCGVCKLDADNVGRVRRLLGEDAHVISVAAAYSTVAAVERYVREQAIDYPVLLAGNDFEQRLGVQAFPTFFVLDARGRIASSTQGYTTTLGLWLRVRWAAALE